MSRLQLAIRRSATATILVALLGLLAIGPGAAGAAASAHKAIASPRTGQTVSGMLRIRPKVAARKGPYTITVKIDRKLYDRQTARTRRSAQSSVPYDSTELANGTHRISVTITAKSRPRKVTQSIKVKVANSSGTPGGAGQEAPTANLNDFKLLVSENFDLDAPLGSFNPDEVPWGQPVYTGSLGTPWVAYPSNYVDTFLKHRYRAKEVLSVHNNALDYYLHPVDGDTAGASLSPVLPGGSQYQTYGRYSVRMRISSTSLSLYHAAFLLWPADDNDYEYAESDFPETGLDAGRQPITGYAHYGPDHTQEVIISPPVDLREWHTYTQEWTPGKRKFYLDGKLIYTTRQKVWNGPMRWELQVQSYRRNGSQKGHLYIDWAAVWGWSPGTKAG